MNKIWYFLIGALLLIVIVVLLFIALGKPNSAPPGSSEVGTFPAAGSAGGTSSTGVATGTQASAGTLTVARNGGGTATVSDFLHNGVTVEDVQNPDQYYLAGAIGYCLPDGSCPSGAPSDEYHIVYSKADEDFIIALIKEPLGQSRLDAEQFLEQTLGISQSDLCSLRYYVGTDVGTNAQYAGQNLGFSFCPGATALPE